MSCISRCCCCYCTIYILMFMFFLACIIFWIVISHSSVKFHITEASLTQFNLTSNNTLYYNFKVNITARNPNNHVIVYYRRITAIVWYKDNDSAYVSLTPFDQGHKNTTFLGPIVFEGQSVIKLKAQQLVEYKEETLVEYKFGRFKSNCFNPPVV